MGRKKEIDKMMKWIEIEIRLFFEDDSKISSWLVNNAEMIEELEQKDVYYQPKSSPYIITKESNEKDADKWLRIRTFNGKTEVCYKHWHRNPETGESLYADEVETMVGEEDAIAKIFEYLEFEEISVIDKKRTSWKYKNFKIDVDEIRNMGKFYEIEFHGDLENPEEGRQLIFDFIKDIGISEWRMIDRGYPWMQWNESW